MHTQQGQIPCKAIGNQLTRIASGRLTTLEFQSLPDRDELPDYYEFTKLPVAFDTIEDKLKRNAYPNISAIESDFKRLVQNAKDYNDPNSGIYEDAERIRKLVFNFMKQHNPAYKEDPNYTAVATPIPRQAPTPAPVQNGGHDGDGKAVESRKVAVRSSEDRKSSMAPSATTGDGEADADGDDDEAYAGAGAGGELDFTGKTFQEAQQAMVSHLLRYTDTE